MRKHVRAVLDDLNKRPPSDSGRFASEQSSPASSGGRGHVAGAPRDKLVGQDGEGDGFLGVGIDTVVGAGRHAKIRQKVAQAAHEPTIMNPAA